MSWKLWVGVAVAACVATAVQAQETWYPSKYGANDTLGAVNNLSAEGAKRAAGLVKSGKVYALGLPTGPDSPVYGERKYTVEALHTPPQGQPALGENKVTAFDEKVTTSLGIGTQMDGLGHLGIDRRHYNGLQANDLATAKGLTKLDLSNIPPIVTRGVLIDMAKQLGGPPPAGKAFTPAEIQAALKAQNLTVGRGDVVLIHTGWMAAKLASDRTAFQTTEPGLGEAAAIWLADQGVVAIGADTIALEAIPFENPNRPFIVHQTLLAKKGVHILENVNVGPLAADGAHEFLFVLGQPRFVGTAQVVVNPVAIR